MSIEKWVSGIINGTGGFKSMEESEFAAFNCRDTAIAEFTLRALANPSCEGSADVLEAIVEQRLGKLEIKRGKVKQQCKLDVSLFFRCDAETLSRIYESIATNGHKLTISEVEKAYKEGKPVWIEDTRNTEGVWAASVVRWDRARRTARLSDFQFIS